MTGTTHKHTSPRTTAPQDQPRDVTVALAQITTGKDVAANLAHAVRSVEEAAKKGAEVIVLPEATMRAFDAGRLDEIAQELDGEFATTLQQVALSLGVVVVAGMFRPSDTIQRGDKRINRVFNTALITGPDVHLGYNKIHCYDAFNYRESDTVHPGEQLVTFTFKGLTFGVATCYDVRFPEQFKALAQAGAQAIILPASWQDGDNKLHQWRTLTRARALDSTSYVLACGQARPGGAQRAGQDEGPTGIGHSAIIDPAGTPVAEAGYGEEIILGTLRGEHLEKVRAMIPVLH